MLKSAATGSAAPCPSAADPVRIWNDERGLGLFEVMAGTVIATLAVLGLAYTFGVGRGLIDRYEVARSALGEAQHVIDSLSVVAPANLAPGSRSFEIAGVHAGTTRWTVTPVDDPLDGLASSSPADPNPVDYYLVAIEVDFGTGTQFDHVQLSRYLPAP
jgi:hypothetical protein